MRLSLYLQVFDVCLLVPALALLFLLIYTSPRCREKLSGSSLLVLALHLSTWATTAILLLRVLLTIGTASSCLTRYYSTVDELTTVLGPLSSAPSFIGGVYMVLRQNVAAHNVYVTKCNITKRKSF
jgi:hypothetical protein